VAPTYIHSPDVKLTLDAGTYENSKHLSLQIIRLENGFDTATIVVQDFQSEFYPLAITAGSAIQVDVKEALASGCAAATILPSKATTNYKEQLRIAFDGDAVLFSDEAEQIYQPFLPVYHENSGPLLLILYYL